MKRLFKWAVAEELVAESVYRGLLAVEGLKAGRSEARETDRIEPVPDEHVEAVLSHLPSPLRGLVLVQRFTGMRPGEAAQMRGRDLDATGEVWVTAAEADALGAGDSYRLVGHQAKRVERAQRMYLSALGALVTFQKLMPVAPVVAESANTVLAAPTQSERTAEQPPAATAAERVPVMMTDDVEPDEPRPETHDRLRVGVTC